MKFVDVKAEYNFYKAEIDAAVSRVLSSGQYFFGKELEKLEKNMAGPSGKSWGVGVKNATDGLQLILQYLWKPGTKIILPNFGAYPTAVAARNVTRTGAYIQYVDVDRSMTIDPNKLPDSFCGSKAILLAVNLFGNDCDFQKLATWALGKKVTLVVDRAQSAGSASEPWGAYSVYSFYPTKPLASMGDGGMITGNDPAAEKYLRQARFYGQDGRKKVVQAGVNSRMDEIQAAIVNVKFDTFQVMTSIRESIAARYLEIVQGITWRAGAAYHLFPVLFNNREKVIAEMEKRKIPYIINYEEHVNEMKQLNGCGLAHPGYRINDKILSIPCHAFMKENEIQKVEEFLNDVKGYEATE